MGRVGVRFRCLVNQPSFPTHFRVPAQRGVLSTRCSYPEGDRSVPWKHGQNGRNDRHLVDCPYPCFLLWYPASNLESQKEALCTRLAWSMFFAWCSFFLTDKTRRRRVVDAASIPPYTAQSVEKLQNEDFYCRTWVQICKFSKRTTRRTQKVMRKSRFRESRQTIFPVWSRKEVMSTPYTSRNTYWQQGTVTTCPKLIPNFQFSEGVVMLQNWRYLWNAWSDLDETSMCIKLRISVF